MTKKLPTDEVRNELEGSVFFKGNRQASPPPEEAQPAPPETPAPSRRRSRARKPEEQASQLASKLASYPDELLRGIRDAIRESGREVTYLRLGAAEKAGLRRLIVDYERQGKKTTETEIIRAAINLVLIDERENGADSLLAHILKQRDS